jgi:hypothetical protein
MGDKSFLSHNLISLLRQKKISVLAQAWGQQDQASPMTYWIRSNELDITGELAVEWDHFRISLIGSGASIQDKDDKLMWTGGDSSGFLTVKNAYMALLSTQSLSILGGWRKKIWKWDIQLKIKLFIWLAAENKILTWDNLQQRGWEGPGWCQLCKKDSEDITHLFIHCTFTKAIWEKIQNGQKIKKVWEGNTLSECLLNWTTDKTVPSILAALICWYIWLERNSTIFEEKAPSILSVVTKTLCSLKRPTASQKLIPYSIMFDYSTL